LPALLIVAFFHLNNKNWVPSEKHWCHSDIN